MKHVAVAISGGRDSLLALALVKERGGPVLALHARFLPPDGEQGRSQLLEDALSRQCLALGVPFSVVDLSEPFARLVTEPFARAYASGLTPNPCAGCNRDLKFGLLADEAGRLGADVLATGHYARLDGEALLRGVDQGKDQSYFLGLVSAAALAGALFPLGSWRKADVSAALAERGLAPPLPGESQDVCFIPGGDYKAYLEAQDLALPGPGPIELEDGRVLGVHQGLWRYTLGQRKGLGLPWSEPLYVVDKVLDRNALLVGGKDRLATCGCRVEQVNLLSDPAGWPETVLARTSYRQRPRPARVELSAGGGLAITLDEPVDKPAPGQLAVLYDQAGRVLAAGIIT